MIRDNDTGFHKIGKANDPEARLRQLIKQDTFQPSPNNYTLIEAWNACSSCEQELHQQFHDCRQRGEWFALTQTDIHDLECQMSQWRRLYAENALDVQELLDEIADLEKQLKKYSIPHPYFECSQQLDRDHPDGLGVIH